jgi:DNA-binding MarR family transcriptional regulator
MAKKVLSEFSEEVFRIMPHILRGMFKRQKDILGAGKITLPQFLSLNLLHIKGLLKMNEIAKALNVSLPAATGLVDRLVSMGMVKRMYDEKDRRAIYVTLTPKGEKTIEEVESSRKKAIEDVFGRLTQKERQDYLAILRKLMKALYPKGYGK